MICFPEPKIFQKDGYNMKTNKNGMITIEASITLIIFISVMAAMVMALNIFIVHNKIQYALTQMSNQLSMFMYLYDDLGIKNVSDKLHDNIDTATENLNDTASNTSELLDSGMTLINDATDISSITDSFNSFSSVIDSIAGSTDSFDANSVTEIRSGMQGMSQGLEDTKSSVYEYLDKLKSNTADVKDNASSTMESFKEWGEKIKENPYSLVMTFIYVCAEQADEAVSKAISSNICHLMARQYLDESDLIAGGVENGFDDLNFSGSNIFRRLENSDGENLQSVRMEIYVTYDIKLPFPFIPLEDNTMHMMQNSSSVAWTRCYQEEDEEDGEEESDEDGDEESDEESEDEDNISSEDDEETNDVDSNESDSSVSEDTSNSSDDHDTETSSDSDGSSEPETESSSQPSVSDAAAET